MKKKRLLMVLALSVSLLVACGNSTSENSSAATESVVQESVISESVSSDETVSSAEDETEVIEAEEAVTDDTIVEKMFKKPRVIMNNEYVKITATGKFYVYEDHEGWNYSGDAAGYYVTIENKSDDQYIQLVPVQGSVDGYMLSDQAGFYLITNIIAPGAKSKDMMHISIDGRELGVDINSIKDLHDADTQIQITTSDDGSTWSSNNMVILPIDKKLP